MVSVAFKAVNPMSKIVAPNGSVLFCPARNDAFGLKLTDESGKNNHGTITGATWERLSSGLYALSFDGDDEVTVADNALLSFGNGTADVAFTMWAWVKMTDVTGFNIFAKMAGIAHREYTFRTNSTDYLSLSLFSALDSGGSLAIYTNSNATLTAYEGKWVMLSASYNGSSLNTGLTLQVNAEEVAVTSGSIGVYVAMQDWEHPLKIGSVNFSGTPGFSVGSMILKGIVRGRELTLGERRAIYQRTRHLFGV